MEVYTSIVNENVKALLRRFGEEAVAEMVNLLQSKGKEASGKLVRSLKANFREALQELVVEFEGAEHLPFVDKGRKPGGKFPPLSKLREWCEIKGIDKKAAYPIARKIARDGIPATDFFELPLMMRIELLKKPLEDSLKQDLVEKLREVAKKINSK